MTSQDDTRYMRLAIAASRDALAAGNFPYGAALVSASGELLHVAQNNQVTTNDCTGHAEVALIREVSAKLGADKLVGATIYASGEPCAMCAGAIFWSRAARLVFGMSNATIMRVGGGDTLAMDSAKVLATASRKIQVDGPLLEDEAADVLRSKG